MHLLWQYELEASLFDIIMQMCICLDRKTDEAIRLRDFHAKMEGDQSETLGMR